MRFHLLALALFVCPMGLALAVQSAQFSGPLPDGIFAGYSLLSNSLNGVPGSHQALNGEDVGLALPSWHGLRVKIDVTRYSGTNLGAKQQALSIMAGVNTSGHSIGSGDLSKLSSATWA
jgi:hypothetical protein